MITATATEMQNNFERYLNLVMSGQEIIVTKNGREVGRFIPKNTAVSSLTDSLTGILKEDDDLDEVKASSMIWKLYETEQVKGMKNSEKFGKTRNGGGNI